MQMSQKVRWISDRLTPPPNMDMTMLPYKYLQHTHTARQMSMILLPPIVVTC